MKKMKTLLSTDWEGKYYQYIESLHFEDIDLQKEFLKLLEQKDPSIREKIWKNLLIKFPNPKEAPKLANPYYIGFGNPESDVLFIGKEKAFDIDKSPNLFLKESIDNLIQWNYLSQEKEPIDHKKMFNKFGFNPFFPMMYNYGKIGKRRTWGIMLKLFQSFMV